MKFRNLRRWRIIRDYCLGWTLAFAFLSIVRGEGTTELGDLKFDYFSSLLIVVTLGPAIGFFSASVQIMTEERLFRRISLRRLLWFRMIYALVFASSSPA